MAFYGSCQDAQPALLVSEDDERCRSRNGGRPDCDVVSEDNKCLRGTYPETSPKP